MSFTRCCHCKGRKQTMGLGAMLKDCPECKGVGYVKPKVIDAPEVQCDPVEVKPKVKRTRRPRALLAEEL